ncbi:hypothetical protein ACFVTC_20750 [Streptomyces sp. NPDC057950]|uniref:hypothetical protein n=1 Tax=Streptomyces sp. NPDC057950 TaxID=3346288 RepID=UPI0036E11524
MRVMVRAQPRPLAAGHDTFTTAPGGTLARSLATPWRLNLAATAYEEPHPDTLAYVREPDHLLTLASPSAVRDHLLARYLPAAAHQHPTRPDRYRPDQTHHWLAALAAHLATTAPAASTASSTDIVLHQLWPMAGPRRVRTADTLLAALLAPVFATLILSRVSIGFSPRQLFGASGGVLLALGTVWQASRPFVPEPQTLQLQRLRSPTHRRQLARTTTSALAFGLAFVLVLGFANVLVLVGWLGLGLRLGLAERLKDAPLTDPRNPVRDDLAFGLAAGLYWLAGAGRRYLDFLLCVRGRLPWRLGTFLNWSYEAGLLRISGVAYQFRHRELQDWLTTHPTPRQRAPPAALYT